MQILFVDDDESVQRSLGPQIKRFGHQVTICSDGPTALMIMREQNFDCLLVDLNMPQMPGLEVIAAAREIRPDLDVVILTGNATEKSAIRAIEQEVQAYIKKPCKLDHLEDKLARIAEGREHRIQIAAMMQRLKHAEGESRLISRCDVMEQLQTMIEKVSPTDSAVLIRGETGTGKELVARGIHELSLRSQSSMVPINCGALPEHLIESELFGHVKGAFTGADANRVGMFELADGGTLFLDEIGELPLAMQAKLLRVLETGDIRPLGSTSTKHVDVRVVCATHRDLEKMVEDGEFREDLMFRINTFEVSVPPLRDRLEDIDVLSRHLIRRHRSDGDDAHLITGDAVELLKTHSWPGNVRELANVIEHAAILCDQLPIDVENLPTHFNRRRLRKEVADATPKSLKELEQEAIESAMTRHDGNKPAVAAELGISLKTLYNKINAGQAKGEAA
ncbi:MAG: sigma-54 dependent transcriptional regulator [Planctomycetota bacterium]